MSTFALSWAWRVRCDPVAKSVLISLADQCNDENLCWPGLDSISKRTCYARSTVVGAIHRLEALKLVSVHERRGKSSYYVLHKEVSEALPGFEYDARNVKVSNLLPHREPEGCGSRRGTDEAGYGVREPDGGDAGAGWEVSGSRMTPLREPDTNHKESKRTVSETTSEPLGSLPLPLASHSATLRSMPEANLQIIGGEANNKKKENSSASRSEAGTPHPEREKNHSENPHVPSQERIDELLERRANEEAGIDKPVKTEEERKWENEREKRDERTSLWKDILRHKVKVNIQHDEFGKVVKGENGVPVVLEIEREKDEKRESRIV